MHTEIPVYLALAMGIAIFTYILNLILVVCYMKRAEKIPEGDPQRHNSLSGLLGTVRSSVRWGTLMSYITFALYVLMWLFGTVAQQNSIVNMLSVVACSLLGAALVCHLVCSLTLSTMKGDSQQPVFAREARKLPSRLLLLGLLELVLYLYLTY